MYLTFAAISYYLLMFRFIQVLAWRGRRRTLLFLGVSLGLCLGSKLYVPGVTFLLVTGFIAVSPSRVPPAPARSPAVPSLDERFRWASGGGPDASVEFPQSFISPAFYPHFYLGWWGGIPDLLHYWAT